MNIPGRKYFHQESVYSDWFSRKGDDMLVRVEVIDWSETSGTPTTLDVTFDIVTKNSEETGNGTPVTLSAPSVSSVTMEANSTRIKTIYIESAALGGLKELVRLRAVASSGNAGEWLQIRIHQPIFFDRAIG